MSPTLHRIGCAALLVAALASGGCARNSAEPILVPTGVRPAPAVGEGAVSGVLVFDRIQAPDLVTPPYPLTAVELWRGADLVVRDTLESDVRTFSFAGLTPGDYTVVAHANFFLATSLPPVRVVSQAVDVGDLELPIDGSDNPSEVHILYDEVLPPRTIPIGNVRDTTGQMESGVLGLWTFPQSFSQPPLLAAGVHRMRFILNRARANPINWTTVTTDTIDVPVSFEPALRIEGAGVDFWIRVAAPTRFAVELDLRLRTISLTPLPVPALPVAAARSPNP